MTRRIAVFTGSRAEYGLLRAVLFQLSAAADVELHLVVSGGHLAQSQGRTLQEIEADGFHNMVRVELDLDVQPPPPVYRSMAQALERTALCLERLQPQMLVVLGDRYEAFGAAAAATALNIPLAHIHGGESTQGAMDEAFRHAITKMSHLHFTSCEAHRQRVIQLGEHPERVWNVGALGVENVLSLPLLPEKEIRALLDVKDLPYFLCTFHPATLERDSATEHLGQLLDALECFTHHHVVFTGANADTGGQAFNAMLAQWVARHARRARLFHSLGVVRYLSAAKYAACVVGNSSSGVIEIPSLGVPVLDIGNRQKGRIRSGAVLHAPAQTQAITDALHAALTPSHGQRVRQLSNPYHVPHTAQRIADILQAHSLRGILNKEFYDVGAGVLA